MKKIIDLKYKEIIDLIKKRETSCEELTKETVDQIEEYDAALGCYISTYHKNDLLKQAGESDKRWKSNSQKSMIDGIPIAVKDNMHSMGINTTCGSNILKNYNPPFDATAVKKIKENGGIIIGKTNLDEFAMGSTTENSSVKKTKNPWDSTRVPGGSSGGSAAAIASKMGVLALGSDTGGSIRQPAAFCGVAGIKPTYGLVSRFGLVAYASSLDQIGTFSRDIYGNAALLELISGYDTSDSTSLDAGKQNYTNKITSSPKDLKIAVFPELYTQGVNPKVKAEFEKSLEIFKKSGASVKEISFSALKYIISTYYFIATAEASSNLSRYDGVKYGYRSHKQTNYDEMLFSSRSDGFGKEVKKRILLGNFVLSSGYYDEYYRKAQKVRAYIMDELKKIFQSFDMIATPTAPDIAFKFGEGEKDPLKLYVSDITTVIPNLAGLPAISVPCGVVDNMPVGMQLIGKPLGEEALFQTGYMFEKGLNATFSPELKNLSVETKITESTKKETKQKQTAAIYTREKIQEISDSYNNRHEKSDRILCKDLSDYLGKKVSLKGRIHKIINLGGIEFHILRDRTGMTQLVIEGSKDSDKINLETVVKVEGKVTKEERSAYNNIEIKVENLEILGTANSNLPLNVSGSFENVTLPAILDNRPVSLRNTKIIEIFKIQSEITSLFSEFLRKKNFSEIKTPKIISSGTEGGTNIFEIKYFNKTAYLAQSPQFYKQFLAGSGLERVFEVGPVFRAEIHDTVRHLNEYTSLDFEMSYINDEQDVIDIHEELVKYIVKGIQKKYPEILQNFDADFVIPEKFPRIHFLEALEIANKFGVKNMDGDISPEGEKVICEYFENEKKSPFVYIVGYPVKKRPMYTMPDERLPGYTRSFDLLFRGLEITTGGMRIHDYNMLKKNIKEFGGNPHEFKEYLDAFKFGMPPHGGLGMGLERLTMKILNLKNVREASLFPRDRNRITP